jgi:uncharacterized membrane protein (UPF0127 family)
MSRTNGRRRNGAALAALITLAGASLWTLGETPSSEPDCPRDLPTKPVDIGGYRLTAEIAATAGDRACGLSRRAHLPADRAMLFVYRYPGILSFWMKDTWVPLDIAFVDTQHRIVDIQTMDPRYPTRVHRSARPAVYALETRAGWFSAHGIGVGTIVHFDAPLRPTAE